MSIFKCFLSIKYNDFSKLIDELTIQKKIVKRIFVHLKTKKKKFDRKGRNLEKRLKKDKLNFSLRKTMVLAQSQAEAYRQLIEIFTKIKDNTEGGQ